METIQITSNDIEQGGKVNYATEVREWGNKKWSAEKKSYIGKEMLRV